MSIRKVGEQSLTGNNVRRGAMILGATSAFATSITLPAHRANDMILVFARAKGQNTYVSAPAGWTLITNSFSNTNWGNFRLDYRWATSSSMTSGTWTNATAMMAVTVRRATGIGGYAATNPATSSQTTAPAVTLSDSSGKSVLLHFYGWGDGVNTQTSVDASAPSGYTRLVSAFSGTVEGICCNAKNSTTTDGSTTQTATVSGWAANSSVEILGI